MNSFQFRRFPLHIPRLSRSFKSALLRMTRFIDLENRWMSLRQKKVSRCKIPTEEKTKVITLTADKTIRKTLKRSRIESDELTVDTAQNAHKKNKHSDVDNILTSQPETQCNVKESKKEILVNLNKPWKVKPQNEEGVLVTRPKLVHKALGLSYTDYVIGSGVLPKPGAEVKLNYVGIFPNGTVFASSMKRTQPLVIRKGINQVVKGLDLGIETMKLGGSREIRVPAELGYGAAGMETIPPNQELIFRVTLLA